MKITSDLTNITTAIFILTVQMFIEWTLGTYNETILYTADSIKIVIKSFILEHETRKPLSV
jgi:hypothetical protein